MVSLGINLSLSTASFILRVVTAMKTDKRIENICKEHVTNVILELSGKIR